MNERVHIQNPIALSDIAKYYGMTLKNFHNMDRRIQMDLLNQFYQNIANKR